MKKKQITKLFAVMAMAASPAAADPAARPDPWAVAAAASPFVPDANLRALENVFAMGFDALASAARSGASAPVAARPRTTPSGAPACGNVASRAPRPRECAVRGPAILADVPPPAPTTAAMPTAAMPTAAVPIAASPSARVAR